MSIHVKRAANYLMTSFRPLWQTSVNSFRQFTTYSSKNLSKIDQLTTTISSRKPSFTTLSSFLKKTYRFEGSKVAAETTLFSRCFALGIAGSAASYWLFNAAEAESPKIEPSKTPEQEELDAIAQKQGEIWECIGREPDENGGYIYRFRLRDAYDFESWRLNDGVDIDEESEDVQARAEAYIRKVEEIFPAVEPILAFLIRGESLMRSDLGYSLSYDKTGIYLNLPDKEALEARCEKLHKINPRFPLIKILSSDGVADDLAFIKAYLTYDLLLSSGKEFVHDHTAHLIRTIRALSKENFILERERFRGKISEMLDRIEWVQNGERDDLKSQLPKIITAIAAVIDLAWTAKRGKDVNDMRLLLKKSRFFSVIELAYQDHWEKKYGEKFDRKSMNSTWKEIRKLEQKPISDHA